MTVEEMKKEENRIRFQLRADIKIVPVYRWERYKEIFSGITKRPRYDTICQLEKAFPLNILYFTDNHGRDYKASGNIGSPEDMKGSVSNPYPGMMKESVSAITDLWRWHKIMKVISGKFRGKNEGEYTLKRV